MTEEELLQNAGEMTRLALDKILDPEYHILNELEELSDNYLLESPHFKSFDTGLTELMVKKGYAGDTTDATAKYKFLYTRCKERNISLTHAVIKSWFNDTRPISSTKSRENVYKLCFALDCTLDEVTEFFFHVYFECPFNFRLCKETVYYFCFLHSLDYNTALNLCIQAEAIFDDTISHDELLYTHTRKIGNALDKLQTQEELLSYIRQHKNEFLTSNQTAYDYAETLIKENTELALKIFESENTEQDYQRKTSIKQNIDLFLLVLFDFDMHIENKNHSFAKESDFPELISANFISKENISRILNRKKVSYDTMRKNLMILEFFNYFAHLKTESEKLGETFCCFEEDFENFLCETEDLLNSCGYPPLYPRNPFDWLIMHCANTAEEPLSEFKNAIQAYYLK